jgi:MFS-type transporter involved in bile tolerance (Atg22 family)
MNLMLAVILVCVAVGLLTPRFQARTYVLIGGVATAMTGLYYFTTRFMT